MNLSRTSGLVSCHIILSLKTLTLIHSTSLLVSPLALTLVSLLLVLQGHLCVQKPHQLFVFQFFGSDLLLLKH